MKTKSLSLTLKRMNVGQSFLAETYMQIPHVAARQIGAKVITRQAGPKIRVWLATPASRTKVNAPKTKTTYFISDKFPMPEFKLGAPRKNLANG